jgi:DnaJ-class molecular chaperone
MSEETNKSALPTLETKCDKCDGTGIYSEGAGDDGICDLCDGAGYIPTETGKRILSIVRHYELKRRRMEKL